MVAATAEPFGKVLWSFRTGAKIWAKPAIGPDLVYVGPDVGTLYAIEKESGQVRWRRQLSHGLTSAAMLDRENLFVATRGDVYRLDPHDGETVWTTPLGRDVVGDIAALDGAIVVASNPTSDELGAEPGPGLLVGIEGVEGTVRWTVELASAVGEPVVGEQSVVFGTEEGELVALDERGAIRWRKALGGAISHAPCVVDGVVYAATDETLFALAVEDGDVAWQFETDGGVTTAPAADDSFLYVAFNRSLYAIHREDALRRYEAGLPLPRWILETPWRIGSVTPHDGLVYAASRSLSILETTAHELLAVDRDTGQLFWRRTFSDTLYASPAIDDGVLYIGNRNHTVYAINIERSGLSPTQSAEIWTEIGLAHLDGGDEAAAIEAFQQSIELDPVHTDAYRNLASTHFDHDRSALGLEVLQSLESVLSGRERDEVGAEIARRGGLLWSRETERLLPLMTLPLLEPPGDEDPDSSPITPSPVVSHGLVLLGTPDGEIQALDAESGRPRWSFSTTDGSIRSTATVGDDTVYFGAGDGNVYALDVATGDERWRRETGGRVDTTPALAAGLVLAGSDDGALYAFDAGTGDPIWRSPTGGRVKSSPRVWADQVFFGSYDGNLYAVRLADGQETWRFETEDIINSSPGVADGTVVLGPDDNHVYAIEADTGEKQWAYRVREGAPPIIATGLADEGGINTFGILPSSPLIVDGTVFVGSNGSSRCQLYAIDLATGLLRWRAPVPNGELGSATWAGGVVYVGSGTVLFHDEQVHAFDAGDGSLLWRFRTEGDVLSAPAVAGNRLYAWSLGGRVYAFDIGAVADAAPWRDSDFFVRAGEVHAENDELGEALAAFQEAIRLDDDNADAHAKLADLYERLGEVEKQKDTLRRLELAAPSATHAYWRLGIIYSTEGRHDEAIAQFEGFLRVLSDESTEPVAYYYLAMAYLAKGGTAQGLTALDRAIDAGAPFVSAGYGTNQDSTIALSATLASMVLKSRTLMAAGEPVLESLDLDLLFLAAARVDDSTSPSIVLSTMAIQDGDYDQAALLLEAAREEEPGSTDVLQALAELKHNHQMAFEESYGFYRQLVEMSPNASSLANLAEAALATGKHEEATDLAEQVIASSDDPVMRANAQLIVTAAALLSQDDAVEAVAELGRVLANLTTFADGWSYESLRTYLTRDGGADDDTIRVIIAAIDVLEGKQPPESFSQRLPEAYSPTSTSDPAPG